MPKTRFEFAPPSAPVDGTLAVPMDIQRIFARLRFDPLLGDTLDATVEFVTGPAAGYPVFDLRQKIREAWLDAKSLHPDQLRHHDLGGGPNAEMRVIERVLESGTEHSLRIVADLGPPQVPMQRNRLPKLEWKGPRLAFRFGFTDRRPGRYLESWLPANLIFDEFELTIDVVVANTRLAHQVVTNGEAECRAPNRWTIRFPKSTRSFSPLLEVYAADRLQSRRKVVALPATGRSITIDAWKLVEDSIDLDSFVSSTGETLALFDAQIGPYAHGDRFVIMADSTNEGMEFAGAMTGPNSLLRHEICHSWWGRSLTPASQDDGWWDEGWTGFFVDRNSQASLSDLTSPPSAFHKRNPWSRISVIVPGSSDSRVFQHIASATGVTTLTDAMRTLYAQNIGMPLKTVTLEEHLLKSIPNPIVVDLFHRFVFGHADLNAEPRLVFVHADKTTAESDSWDAPALWNRYEADGGVEHQSPAGNQVNWLHSRIRNDGLEAVLHAAVVFQAHESPVFDPAGPGVAPNAVAASVQQDWMPGEERVVSVSWIPDPSQFVALSARLMTRGLHCAPGTVSEWATTAWKYRQSITAIPDQEIFVSLFLRNGLEKEERPLLLELIRGSTPEPIEVVLSHTVGLPVIVCPEIANAPYSSQTPVATAIQEFLFPPDSRSDLLLLLPSQSVLIPELRFTVPAGAPNGSVIKFDVVARRPEDRVVVGGLALTIAIERFD